MVLKKNHSYVDLVMSLTPGGMKTGRDSLMKLLAHIGSPQDTLQVFHVTGSNGKGSVCQMISQVLYKQFGKKVGLFTSPHLIDITERFQINGTLISYTQLNTYYKKVLGLAKRYTIELSFFEIQVAAMVLYFSDEKIEYAVIEVGVGGLYDGTNIFKHPLACFITSITFEHTHILGKTRKSILRNKLGIVKKGTTLYTHIKNKQVKDYCQKIGAKLETGNLKLETQKLTSLVGKHQQKNALLVLQALIDLGFDSGSVLEGLKKIYNPGRFEWISPYLFVDSANNEESIRLLKSMLKDTLPGSSIIFGTTQTDSNYAAQLANIFPHQEKILVDGFCERALPCSEYAHLVPLSIVKHLDTNIGRHCIKKIVQQQSTNPKKYIIYGSIYLVGYVIALSRYNVFAKR